MAAARPPVAGVTRNADVTLKRSSRIGLGDGTTAPLGMATVNVIASKGSSGAFVKVASAPVDAAVVHGKVEPYCPVVHPTRWMVAGAWTTALACSIGTDQSVPTAFHTSSSWSANGLSAARTR